MFDLVNRRFSYYAFAILCVAAGLFSYFVLSHNNATAFFGVAAIACLFISGAKVQRENEFEAVYRSINDHAEGCRRDNDAIYRYVDDRIAECGETCKANKPGR